MQRSADTYRPSYSVYDGWRSPPSPDRFIPRRSISPGFSRPFEEDDRRYEPGHRRSFAERIEPDSYRPDEHLHEDPGLRLLRRMDVGQRGRDAYDSRDRELSESSFRCSVCRSPGSMRSPHFRSSSIILRFKTTCRHLAATSFSLAFACTSTYSFCATLSTPRSFTLS
jgi:hypothetical protein